MKENETTRNALKKMKLLKKQLKYGDIERIAELTEYAANYVRNCISAERHNRLIWKAAELIIDERIKSDKIIKSKMREAA